MCRQMNSECKDARQRQALCARAGRCWSPHGLRWAPCSGLHAGREQLAVRVLGGGWPCVLELADAGAHIGFMQAGKTWT